MRSPWIVIVDDNPSDVFIIREALVVHGVEAEVTVFEDGEAALEFVSSRRTDDDIPYPDLILLDISLPRIDGFAVLERLRETLSFADVPVVMMTSSLAASDRAKAAELGSDDYFQKPLSYEDFLTIGAAIRKQLSRSRRIRAAEAFL
jgi:two-component system, chemotaxis family, response regulator Rcp1